MTKRGLLVFGLAVIAAAWLGPLPELAIEHFAAIAALDVALVSAAAPLLAAAAGGSRFDPVVRWPHGFSPLAASLLQWGVAWGWHTPAAQLVIRSAPAGLWLQQLSFLLASVLLWLSVLGGERAARYERAGAGIVALLLTSVHMTMLAGLALISGSPFGGIELAASLDDRRLGALLTIGGAAIIYVIAGAMLIERLLRPQAERASVSRASPGEPAEAEAHRQRDVREVAALVIEADAEIAEEVPAQTGIQHGARLELPLVQQQLAVGARAGRRE